MVYRLYIQAVCLLANATGSPRAALSGVSKNYAAQLADLSRPSGSSSKCCTSLYL